MKYSRLYPQGRRWYWLFQSSKILIYDTILHVWNKNKRSKLYWPSSDDLLPLCYRKILLRKYWFKRNLTRQWSFLFFYCSLPFNNTKQYLVVHMQQRKFFINFIMQQYNDNFYKKYAITVKKHLLKDAFIYPKINFEMCSTWLFTFLQIFENLLCTLYGNIYEKSISRPVFWGKWKSDINSFSPINAVEENSRCISIACKLRRWHGWNRGSASN